MGLLSKQINDVADKIRLLLRDEADEWHVVIIEKQILCSYTNDIRFYINYDNELEDWFITGKDVCIEIISDIWKILENVNCISIK